MLQAASCSQADVQARIDQAQDGDTVLIPAGSCTWNAPVKLVDKAVVLRGAGKSSTIINPAVDQALDVSEPHGKSFQISNLQFAGGAGSNGIIAIGGSAKSWRIHDVHFASNGQNRAIRTFSSTYGLIDHCSTSGPIIEFATIDDDDWLSWQRPFTFGTAGAVYLEDNDIHWSTGYEGEPVFDSERGGRLVFRNNQVVNSVPGNHGFDTGGSSSAIGFELYGNTFSFDDGFNSGGGTLAWGILVRGGTGVIHDNTWNLPGSFWAWDHLTLSIFRIALQSTTEQSHLSWPTCDGTQLKMCSNVDKSWNLLGGTWNAVACSTDTQCGAGYTCKWKTCSASRMNLCAADSDCPVGESCSSFLDGGGVGGTPCFQQPGYGAQMKSMPMYEWNNVMNGAQFGMGHNLRFNAEQPQIVAGRDYFDDTKPPGYVPYVYPHPLAQLGR